MKAGCGEIQYQCETGLHPSFSRVPLLYFQVSTIYKSALTPLPHQLSSIFGISTNETLSIRLGHLYHLLGRQTIRQQMVVQSILSCCHISSLPLLLPVYSSIMPKLLLSLASVLSLFVPFIDAYADPGPCSGACWAHDPSIIQRESDGLYFKFNTGSGMEISTASSLSGSWTIQGSVLPDGTSITTVGQTTDMWAPDVHKVGDLYFLYYAVSTFGSQTSAIGLATSSTMDPGTWTDKGSVGVTSSSSKAYNAIDPNLIQVDNNYLLSFGSFWGDIYQVELSSDATKGGGGSSYQIAYNPSGNHAVEGSYVFSYDGYYYLTWSAGICCGYDTSLPAAGEEYKIVVCRSSSATGGFIDQDGNDCLNGGGTVLLESHGTTYGPGGQ